MIKKLDRSKVRLRKHARVRLRINGTPVRPRLSVFRSNTHMYAQLIDDVNGVTLAASSTLDPSIKAEFSYGGNVQAAAAVGKQLAERALAKNIETVVFDRGGYIYHGRVKAVAEAAREAGLKF